MPLKEESTGTLPSRSDRGLVRLRLKHCGHTKNNDLEADHCPQPFGTNVLFHFEDAYSSEPFFPTRSGTTSSGTAKVEKILLLIDWIGALLNKAH